MTKVTWPSTLVEELHGRKIFENFQTKSGELISTGDFVQLIPADPCIEKFVGKVESIYEDDSGLKHIQVRWFYRPQDLQHEPPVDPLENEVYHTSYYDCQLVESVVGRCVVMHTREYFSTKSRLASTHTSQDAMDVYTCRYSYCGEMGQFVGVEQEALAGSTPKSASIEGKANGNTNFSYGDTPVARRLANALLGVDRSVPREVARADWSTAKRLPWVLRAKNAMTLEDVKQLLIDLECGLEVFKHQRGWIKSVRAISTFDALNSHIRYFQQNAQQKVDETFKKLRRAHLDRHIRKRKPVGMPRLEQKKWSESEKGCTPEKQGRFKKVITGASFAIDRLRVVMGAASRCRLEKHSVEEQMDDLWKSVEVVQDDVALVLDSMGFSQAMVPVRSSEPISNNLSALTDSVEDNGPDEIVRESTSKENILLFQMAAQGPMCKGLRGDYTTNELSSPVSKQRSAMETTSLSYFSLEKQVVALKEEQEGSGFRLWKPEGGLVSPSARNITCFQNETNKQMNISRPVLV